MIKAKFHFTDDPREKLKVLEKDQYRILKSSIGRAMRPVRQALRAAAPKRTGNLKLSIFSKVAVSKKKQRVIGIAGPRVGFNKKGRDPSNIFSLLEHGHKGPAPAPPHPFVEAVYLRVAKPFATQVLSEIKAETMKILARKK